MSADEVGEQSVGLRRLAQIYRQGALGRRPKVPADFAELERRARRASGAAAWAYVAGGAGEGRTMLRNRAAFDRWAILPRVATGVAERDLSVDLFGTRHATPVLLAPECAAAMGDDERWFQLYWSRDDGLVDSLISRAEVVGAGALVVTLDTTVLGWRPQDLNLGSLPFSRGLGIAQYSSDPRFAEIVTERLASPSPRPTEVTLGAIRTLLAMTRNHPGGFWRNLRSPRPRAAVETFLDVYSNPGLSWEHLATLRERTQLPVVLKGILHPDDARRAFDDLGVAGIGPALLRAALP